MKTATKKPCCAASRIPAIKWRKGVCGGYSAEVLVSQSGGPISYLLEIAPGFHGVDYWIVHRHFIKDNGLYLREDALNAKTVKEAKEKCVKWMQKEIRKIRDDCHRFL